MYQEIKSDSIALILQAIEVAFATTESFSVTLKKRGHDYEATLFEVSEPEETTEIST